MTYCLLPTAAAPLCLIYFVSVGICVYVWRVLVWRPALCHIPFESGTGLPRCMHAAPHGGVCAFHAFPFDSINLCLVAFMSFVLLAPCLEYGSRVRVTFKRARV